MYEGTYDFYRIKDMLDQFSTGQLESKQWLIDEIQQFITNDDSIFVCGGWYGLMSHMLAETKIPKKIVDYELDDQCRYLHDKLKVHNIVSTREGDGLEIFDNKDRNKENIVFVCTACEHIDEEDLYSALSMKHPKMLVALQSNDMYDIDSHINCHDSIDHFVETLPDMNILYKGELTVGDYSRFMVIAR